MPVEKVFNRKILDLYLSCPEEFIELLSSSSSGYPFIVRPKKIMSFKCIFPKALSKGHVHVEAQSSDQVLCFISFLVAFALKEYIDEHKNEKLILPSINKKSSNSTCSVKTAENEGTIMTCTNTTSSCCSSVTRETRDCVSCKKHVYELTRLSTQNSIILNSLVTSCNANRRLEDKVSAFENYFSTVNSSRQDQDTNRIRELEQENQILSLKVNKWKEKIKKREAKLMSWAEEKRDSQRELERENSSLTLKLIKTKEELAHLREYNDDRNHSMNHHDAFAKGT